MRVTHIITRLVVGGAQENTVASVLGLRQKPGVEIHLLSGPTTGPEGSLESELARLPDLLTRVPALVRPVHPLKDWLALRQLEKILRQQRPDIVHTHSGKAGILGRLAARRAGVPVIIHHIHGPSFGPFQGWPANWIFTAAERYAARATTHFVCSAQAMTRLYLAAGIGRSEMYTRVFSGFPVEPFVNATNDPALRGQFGLNKNHFVIGKIARLFKLKGHADLLAAFQKILPQIPQARLLLVGDGALRNEIENQARALGLQGKVIFAGLVPPGEVPRYVGIMDCLAHLSSREALSRALPRRWRRANRSWLMISTAPTRCVSKVKPGFWSAPATLTPSPNGCNNLPATRRCASASAAGDSNSSAKILPSNKWWTTFMLFT